MTGKTAVYEEEDLDAGWSEEESVVITCDGTEVVMEDSGVEETGNAAAESGIIRITAAGTYILRGTYNGQIQVDAGKDDLVRLVMDGFNISNESTSPIYGLSLIHICGQPGTPPAGKKERAGRKRFCHSPPD